MLTRKTFIYNNMMAAGTLFAGKSLLSEIDADKRSYQLTVLHTNDVHSRIEPFPMDGGSNQGLGGVAARAEIIEKIRREEEHVLLLDAGDIFQGTPYFNFYKGEPEIKAMSSMGYEATTIGNHDFDGGLENLAMQLTNHAKFPMLVSNYDFTGTPMEYRHEPYKVFKKGKIKIGVFGLGVEMAGLVPENLSAGTKYLEPVTKGNETENIDLIIGGHTHTFLNAPVEFKNRKGDDVIVNQVGWAGINLGRLDFNFSKYPEKKLSQSSSITVTKKTEE